MQEMLALANEMAQRIAYDNRDWTMLKTTVTYTGDGVTTAFDLPANYKRMLLTSNVWRSSSTQTPMSFVPDLDEWLSRRADDWSTAHGEWTIYGGQIHFWPALAVGETALFRLPRQELRGAEPAAATAIVFLNDADTFRLDERLLKLGMIWSGRRRKARPTRRTWANYGDAVAMAQGHDSPSPIIVGRLPMSANARVAYPWPVPTNIHEHTLTININNK